MDLIEAKIAEIKNLNLIYIFTTDNLLKETEQYLGIKIVYDKDKTFYLDYKSEHFEKLIKKILVRYNKEKDKRNIVLLGGLTKKIVNDPSFVVSDNNNQLVQPKGILVNENKSQIKLYEFYLNRVLSTIIKLVMGYDVVKINKIDGFNHKWYVEYSIGEITKQLFLLIFIHDEDRISFKITNIEGVVLNITGEIKNNLSTVDATWYDDVNVIKGFITYDSLDNIIYERIYKDEEPIISRETTDTLIEEDEEIINFYIKLCNLERYENVTKIDDNCYLLTECKNINENDDGIFYSDKSLWITIFDDQVIIKDRVLNGLNKYNNQIKVVLEDNKSKYVIKMLTIEDKNYLLVERKQINKGKVEYSYELLESNEITKLIQPFEIKKKYKVKRKLKTLDMAKQYITETKRDDGNDTI